MIIMAFLNLVFSVLKVLFSWVNLPSMPVKMGEIVDTVMQMIHQGTSILFLFFDKDYVITCLTFSLAIYNFEYIYDALMWVLAKFPIGIKKN